VLLLMMLLCLLLLLLYVPQPYLKFHNPRTFEDMDKPIPNFKKFGLKSGGTHTRAAAGHSTQHMVGTCGSGSGWLHMRFAAQHCM
jgi:hypothetical protein